MLDLTRVLAGPSCAKAFAEHGADVMRITRKDLPDLGPPSDVDTGIGKLQAHIDMRDPAQAEIMRGLVKDCDVFLQGYRPGALAARGLSPEALAETRPGIVYVTLSAWGHEGPWKDKRGYDTVVQSFNGMAWRPNNEKPQFLPGSPHDYIAGYVLAFATMVALCIAAPPSAAAGWCAPRWSARASGSGLSTALSPSPTRTCRPSFRPRC